MAQKIGRILLCGLTNAGKSTLINKLANYQLALVNPRPQTTRKATQFWYHQEEYSVLFIDTPGYQLNKNKLAYFMNKEIVSNYKKANCVCFLYDLTTNWDQLTVSFLNQLKRKVADKLVVVFTKDDLVAPKKLSSTIDRCYKQINNYLVVQDYFVTNQNDANLLTKLFLKTKRFLTADSDQGFQTTDHDNFVIGEVIRGVG